MILSAFVTDVLLRNFCETIDGRREITGFLMNLKSSIFSPIKIISASEKAIKIEIKISFVFSFYLWFIYSYCLGPY